MNKIFAHHKLKYTKYLELFTIALIPLILYGIYKNAIFLYFKKIVTIWYLFKPIILIIYSIGIGYLLAKLFKNNEPIHLGVLNLLITMCLSINTNLYFFFGTLLILDIMYLLFLKKVPINFVAISVILITLGHKIFTDLSFVNHYEAIKIYSYSFSDYLLGRSIGGMCSTSIVLSVIALFYLSSLKYYKKDIAITSISLYLMMGLWYLVIDHDFTNMIMYFSSYSSVFAFIFIVPINMYSPKITKERYLFSALITIITFIFCFILKEPLGVFYAIIIINVIFFLKNLIKKKRKLSKKR